MSYKIALLENGTQPLKNSREQVEAMLREAGLDAAVMAYHGAFDVSALAVDAYLLDISMPEADGLTVAARIRQTGSAAPISRFKRQEVKEELKRMMFHA